MSALSLDSLLGKKRRYCRCQPVGQRNELYRTAGIFIGKRARCRARENLPDIVARIHGFRFRRVTTHLSTPSFSVFHTRMPSTDFNYAFVTTIQNCFVHFFQWINMYNRGSLNVLFFVIGFLKLFFARSFVLFLFFSFFLCVSVGIVSNSCCQIPFLSILFSFLLFFEPFAHVFWCISYLGIIAKLLTEWSVSFTRGSSAQPIVATSGHRIYPTTEKDLEKLLNSR